MKPPRVSCSYVGAPTILSKDIARSASIEHSPKRVQCPYYESTSALRSVMPYLNIVRVTHGQENHLVVRLPCSHMII